MPSAGPMVVPSELNACVRFRRLEAVFCRPENRDVRVRGDLEQRDAGGEHEEGAEEERVGTGARGRIEQQAACARHEQPEHDARLVSHALDQHARGQGHHEIGAEEAELDQHHLHVGQLERCPQVRDEDVVERRDQPPDEEQRRQHDQSAGVGLLVGEFIAGPLATRRPLRSAPAAPRPPSWRPPRP